MTPVEMKTMALWPLEVKDPDLHGIDGNTWATDFMGS